MERNCKNTSCNRNLFNQIRNRKSRNSMVPEILVNQLWMQEEDAIEEDPSALKITELDSSSDSSKEQANFNHAWSYVDYGRFSEQDDRYRINEEARRTRRMNMNHTPNFMDAYANQYSYDHHIQSQNNSFYDTYESGINSAPINHQMNCFTIINNQHVKSESSTDDENYESMEIIEIDAEENDRWHHVYNEEIINYDPHMQREKRTIWIYSYKNKRLLSQNDFELVSIPGQDSSSTSSCSKSDEEQKAVKDTTVRRTRSPIPDAYVPRLDLSVAQTLSTVTELTEPNKSYSKESSQEMIHLKPTNNWLSDKNDEINQMKKSNIINWIALSPRDKRRHSISTNSDSTDKENVEETEITYMKTSGQLDQVSVRSKAQSSTVQLVDVQTTEEETSGEIAAGADDIVDNNTELNNATKPSIKISTTIAKTITTEPIVKLHCDNWISEEQIETKTTAYDYDLNNVKEIDVIESSSENVIDSASTGLWIRNLESMKPPEQAEQYLPVTSRRPSLHLSLSLSSIDSKSWFKRLTKCLKCCK